MKLLRTQITTAKDKELDELKQETARQIEEETRKATEHAQKMIENAETVTRETLAACRYESEERVKKIIAECDAKVSGSHVRKTTNITDYSCFSSMVSFNLCEISFEQYDFGLIMGWGLVRSCLYTLSAVLSVLSVMFENILL